MKLRILLLTGLALLPFLPSQAQTYIRISGDSAVRAPGGVTDINTGQAIQFIRGDFLNIDFGMFDNGSFRTNLSYFTNISLGVWSAQNTTNSPLMFQTITNTNALTAGTNGLWNAACTSNNWISNPPPSLTNFSMEFQFSDAQSSLPLGGEAAASFWLRVAALSTNGRNVTYLECPITVYDGPINPNWSPSTWAGIPLDGLGDVLSVLNSGLSNFEAMTNALTQGGFTSGSHIVFNTGQFSGAGGATNIVSGASLTNISIQEALSGGSAFYANGEYFNFQDYVDATPTPQINLNTAAGQNEFINFNYGPANEYSYVWSLGGASNNWQLQDNISARNPISVASGTDIITLSGAMVSPSNVTAALFTGNGYPLTNLNITSSYFFDGDSLSDWGNVAASVPFDGSTNLPVDFVDQLLQQPGYYVNYTNANFAKSGHTAYQQYTNLLAGHGPPLSPPANSVLIYPCGDNDIANGSNAVQTIGNLSNYYRLAASSGYTLVASTENWLSNYTSGESNYWRTTQQWIRTNGITTNVFDWAAVVTNAYTQTADGSHPTALANQQLAAAFASQFNFGSSVNASQLARALVVSNIVSPSGLSIAGNVTNDGNFKSTGGIISQTVQTLGGSYTAPDNKSSWSFTGNLAIGTDNDNVPGDLQVGNDIVVGNTVYSTEIVDYGGTYGRLAYYGSGGGILASATNTSDFTFTGGQLSLNGTYQGNTFPTNGNVASVAMNIGGGTNSSGYPILFSASSAANNASGLTNLNASALASGTVPYNVLPASIPTNNYIPQVSYVRLTNQFSGANGTVPTGWTTNQSSALPTFTNNNNTLVLNATAGEGAVYCTNEYNGSQYWTATFDSRSITMGGGGYSWGFAMISHMLSTNTQSVGFLIGNSNTAASLNGLELCTGSPAVINTGGIGARTTNAWTQAPGDWLTWKIVRYGDSVIWSVTNNTQGGQICMNRSMYVQNTSGVLTNAYLGDSGYPGFYIFNGQVAVSNFVFSIQSPAIITTFILADSVACGYEAEAYDRSWSHTLLHHLEGSGLTYGLPGDATANVELEMPQILQLLLPSSNYVTAIVHLGLNDNTYYNTGTYLTNLTNIQHQLYTNGASVILASPSSSSSASMEPYAEIVRTNATYYLDLYEPLVASGNGILTTSTLYSSSDNSSHPNQAGHDALASVAEGWLATHQTVRTVGANSWTYNYYFK